MTVRERCLVLACVLLAPQQLAAAQPAEVMQAFESRAAMLHLSHARTLAQRISRQNLLVQTRLAEGHRPAMERSVGEMDALLRMLGEGDAILSVPVPPTPELRSALEAVDEAWTPLRNLALASPYDYVRRSGLGRLPPGDPQLVGHFDDLATALDERARATVADYQRACEQNGLPDCGIDASATAPVALELVAKEVTFVVSGDDTEQRRAALRNARDEFAETLRSSIDSPRAKRAMAAGTTGGRIARIASRIVEDWEALRVAVDHALGGRGDDVDVERMLETQSDLLYSFHRLSIALLTADTPLAGGGNAQAEMFQYEYASAQQRLGSIRGFAHRLNKDNLLYRLRIDGSYKLGTVIDTATRIDEALRSLQAGDPRTGVPGPPTPEIEEQLAALEQQWVPIGQLTRSNPLDYLRGRGLLEKRRASPLDPLALYYLDRVIGELIEEVDRTASMYAAACKADGYPACERRAVSGAAVMLSEVLVKESVFQFAGIDFDGNLEENRKVMDGFLASPSGRRELDKAIEMATGREARRARTLRDESRSLWSDLQRELDLIMQGSAEAANLRRAIELQRSIALELDRLEVAVGRLALFEATAQAPPLDVTPRPGDGVF